MPFKDKEKQRAYAAQYHLENRVKKNKQRAINQKRYTKKNPEKIREDCRRYQQIVRRKVLMHYSNGALVCICCGDNRYCFLTIDHIIPIRKRNQTGSALHYRLVRENFPVGFQVLCMNCNKLKRDYAKCPCNQLIPESQKPVWRIEVLIGA